MAAGRSSTPRNRNQQRANRVSDPWEKSLRWVAWIVWGLMALVVVQLIATMAWRGGAATEALKGYRGRDSLIIQAWREEAPRIEAEREALARCKVASTPEDCG